MKENHSVFRTLSPASAYSDLHQTTIFPYIFAFLLFSRLYFSRLYFSRIMPNSRPFYFRAPKNLCEFFYVRSSLVGHFRQYLHSLIYSNPLNRPGRRAFFLATSSPLDILLCCVCSWDFCCLENCSWSMFWCSGF